MWIHTARRAVDNHVVFLYHFGRYIFILYTSLPVEAAHGKSLHAKRLKAEDDGLAGSARSEYQRFLVVSLQQRLDTLSKSYHVAVVTL